MKTQTIKLLLIVAMGHLMSLGVIASDDFDTIYASFQQAIINQDDDTALEVGDQLFEHLSSNHRTDAGFEIFKRLVEKREQEYNILI